MTTTLPVITPEDRRVLKEMYKHFLEQTANRGSEIPKDGDLDNGSNWYLARATQAIPKASSSTSPSYGKVAIDLVTLPSGSQATNPQRRVTAAKWGNVDVTIQYAYNLSTSNSYIINERIWVVRLANGPFVIVPFSGKGGEDATGGCCSCVSIPVGDIVVDGIETTSVWLAKLTADVKIGQTNGTVIVKKGDYSLVWDPAEEYWIHEFSTAELSAVYLSGNSAVDDLDLGGSGSSSGPEPYIHVDMIMRRNDGNYTTVKITVTGDIPAEGST